MISGMGSMAVELSYDTMNSTLLMRYIPTNLTVSFTLKNDAGESSPQSFSLANKTLPQINEGDQPGELIPNCVRRGNT
jgi:hypothetical protein